MENNEKGTITCNLNTATHAIHGDLAKSNILLSDSELLLKVTDFGLPR